MDALHLSSSRNRYHDHVDPRSLSNAFVSPNAYQRRAALVYLSEPDLARAVIEDSSYSVRRRAFDLLATKAREIYQSQEGEYREAQLDLFCQYLEQIASTSEAGILKEIAQQLLKKIRNGEMIQEILTPENPLWDLIWRARTRLNHLKSLVYDPNMLF